MVALTPETKKDFGALRSRVTRGDLPLPMVAWSRRPVEMTCFVSGSTGQLFFTIPAAELRRWRPEEARGIGVDQLLKQA